MASSDAGAPRLTVVLPAYNELGLLGSTVTNLVTGLNARGLDYELVIVENGSTDETLRLARMLEAQIPAVRVISLPVGDYGAALATGFDAARGDYVVNFDVDYYELTFIDTALQALDAKRAAIVLASKRVAGASDRRPLLRRVLTGGFAVATRRILGMTASDAHGMKAMSRELVSPIVEQCVMRGSLFDVEVVVRAGRRGLAIEEVPAVVVERRSPRTSVWRRAVEAAVGTVRLALVLRREDRRRVSRARGRVGASTR